MSKVSVYVMVIAMIFVCCQNRVDEKYILSKGWEHGGGIKIGNGDFIHFVPELVTLCNDTIFVKGIPIDRIIELTDNKMDLNVQSLKSGSGGFYVNIEEFEQ